MQNNLQGDQIKSPISYLATFFETKQKFEWDASIGETNWLLVWFIQFIGYFFLLALIFNVVPEPGPFKQF